MTSDSNEIIKNSKNEKGTISDMISELEKVQRKLTYYHERTLEYNAKFKEAQQEEEAILNRFHSDYSVKVTPYSHKLLYTAALGLAPLILGGGVTAGAVTTAITTTALIDSASLLATLASKIYHSNILTDNASQQMISKDTVENIAKTVSTGDVTKPKFTEDIALVSDTPKIPLIKSKSETNLLDLLNNNTDQHNQFNKLQNRLLAVHQGTNIGTAEVGARLNYIETETRHDINFLIERVELLQKKNMYTEQKMEQIMQQIELLISKK